MNELVLICHFEELGDTLIDPLVETSEEKVAEHPSSTRAFYVGGPGTLVTGSELDNEKCNIKLLLHKGTLRCSKAIDHDTELVAWCGLSSRPCVSCHCFCFQYLSYD